MTITKLVGKNRLTEHRERERNSNQRDNNRKPNAPKRNETKKNQIQLEIENSFDDEFVDFEFVNRTSAFFGNNKINVSVRVSAIVNVNV